MIISTITTILNFRFPLQFPNNARSDDWALLFYIIENQESIYKRFFFPEWVPYFTPM